MALFHIVILALVQGITEFLPISSSGHLILLHELFGDNALETWETNLSLDVAVHVGTLLAVLLYFRRDLVSMLNGIANAENRQGRRLVYFLVAGSIPVIAAGFILYLLEPGWLRSVKVTAWCTLIFGIVLWISDRRGGTERTLENMGFKDALLIGLTQVLALIPGTSRSGITITTARFLGFSRTEAAHFSLLLSIIAISGAGTLSGFGLFRSGNLALGLDIGLAILLSFISSLGAIALMLKWLKKASFAPFVYYRIALGLLLLYLIYL